MVDMKIESQGAMTIVHLSGEMTAADSEGVIEDLHGLVGDSGARLAMDLSGVELIDSSGLSSMMNLVSRARLSDGRVVLVSPTKFVSSIFAVTRLDQWFEICATMDEARESLAAE